MLFFGFQEQEATGALDERRVNPMGGHELAEEFGVVFAQNVGAVKIGGIMTPAHECQWFGGAAMKLLITGVHQQIDAKDNEYV